MYTGKQRQNVSLYSILKVIALTLSQNCKFLFNLETLLIKVNKFFCLLVLCAAPLLSFSQDYKGQIPSRTSNQNYIYTPKDSLAPRLAPTDSSKKKATVLKKDSLNNTSKQNYNYTHQDSLALSSPPSDSSKKKAIVSQKDSLYKDSLNNADTLRVDWKGSDSTFKDRNPALVKDTSKTIDTLKNNLNSTDDSIH